MNRNTRNIYKTQEAAGTRQVERAAESLERVLREAAHALRAPQQEKERILQLLRSDRYETSAYSDWEAGYGAAIRIAVEDIQNDVHWQAENE